MRKEECCFGGYWDMPAALAQYAEDRLCDYLEAEGLFYVVKPLACFVIIRIEFSIACETPQEIYKHMLGVMQIAHDLRISTTTKYAMQPDPHKNGGAEYSGEEVPQPIQKEDSFRTHLTGAVAEIIHGMRGTLNELILRGAERAASRFVSQEKEV